MKSFSFIAIGTVCSISLSFIAKVYPAVAVISNNNNHSFSTIQLLPSGTSSVDGQLSPNQVDYYNFSGLTPGSLFDALVNVTPNTIDPLLAELDGSGNIQTLNDDRTDTNLLSEITGIVPTNGILNFGVSGTKDVGLTGNHNESGPYSLLFNTSSLPQTPVNAKLTNGNFGTNNFTGWATLGNNTIQTSQGTSQALLSNEGNSYSQPILEQLLGLQSGSLEGLLTLPPGYPFTDTGPSPNVTPPQGSVIQQTFTAKAGQVLSFDWNFLTKEVPGGLGLAAGVPDFSFVSLTSPSNSISQLSALATSLPFDPNSPQLTISQNPEFFQETGLHHFSYTIPKDGTYTLGLGVSNFFDNSTESALSVSNVQVVPESSSVLSLLGFSVVLGAGSVLKRSRLIK